MSANRLRIRRHMFMWCRSLPSIKSLSSHIAIRSTYLVHAKCAFARHITHHTSNEGREGFVILPSIFMHHHMQECAGVSGSERG